ncbi:MAG: hypothetical protein CMN32_07265 [Saprospirales bacterium]|nr:hypothetical protein [Saprospirales bacterium]
MIQVYKYQAIRSKALFWMVLFLIACTNLAKASHIIGGEIRYQCLGNNQYRVILDVYRDCYYGQAPFDQPAHISVFTGAGTFVNNLNLPILYSDTIPNNIAGDPCLFPPSDVCVEHARYEDTIKLQQQTGGYYFVYQRCCRNKTISNIIQPDSTGATYFVYLSEYAMSLCNSSPEFGETPPVFVCVNKPINHPNAATDLDGDSLVYSFYTPFKGASITSPQPPFASPPPYDTVTWLDPPYNLNNILGANPPLTIDPSTGLITGTPMVSGQFVVGVMVEEYRNGFLLSRVRRDFQYNVGQCGIIEATIVAPDAQCDDLTVSFQNNTNIADEWLWYFQWPDTTIFSTEKEPVYTFPDTGNYTIALIAQPESQCVDTGYHQLFLQYNSLTPDFTIETFDCDTTSVLKLTDTSVDTVSDLVSWYWEVDIGDTVLTSALQNPVFVIPNPSSGTVTLSVASQNGCEQVLQKNFEAGANNPSLFLEDLEVCIGNSIELNPNGPTNGFTYIWDDPISIFDKFNPNPTVSPDTNTTYTVTVQAYSNLCQVKDTVEVTVVPLPVLDFEYVTGCDSRQVQFTNLSVNSPDGYFWDFGVPSSNSDTTSEVNPAFFYPDFGSFDVTMMTSPSALCKDTLVETITLVEKILEADFTYDYTNCDEDQITVNFYDDTNNSLNNSTQWNWIFEGVVNESSTIQNPEIVVSVNGSLQVTLIVTTAEGCSDTIGPEELTIEIIDLPGITDGDEVLGCLNEGVQLNVGGNPDYQYSWFPADGLSCTDCPSPFANPEHTTTYTVVVNSYSSDTCSLQKTITVMVPENPNLDAGDDVLTCDASVQLNAETDFPVTEINWFNNGVLVGSGNQLDVAVSGIMPFSVIAVDQFGCQYLDAVLVKGGPVDIQTSEDMVLCSDEQIQVSVSNLDPNDNLIYTWSPDSLITGDVNVAAPDVIVEPGIFTLYINAENQFGCTNQDTVNIVVLDQNMDLSFDYQVDCEGYEVQFVNTSNNAFGFLWDFGVQGSQTDISHETNPVFTFPDTGTYEVFLTVDYFAECVDTVSEFIHIVEPVIEADFSYDYVECSPDSILIQFFDETTNFLGNTNSWEWSTSSGQVSNEQNPVFTVYAGEELEISLGIGTENGCTDSIQKSLELEFISFNEADTIILCKGDSVLINSSGNTSYQYSWLPANNIDNPTSPSPTVWPDQTTTYTVEITNFVGDTCSILKSVTVVVPEAIQLDVVNDTVSCGEPVDLAASANVSPLTLNWYDSAGALIANGPTISVDIVADDFIVVEGVDQYSCKASDTININFEAIDIVIIADELACPDSTVQLMVSNNVGDHNLTYHWSTQPPASILSPDDEAVVSVITGPAGTSSFIQLTATNQFGCEASESVEITSHDFIPEFESLIKACAGDTVELNPNGNSSQQYSWSPSTGLFPSGDVMNPSIIVAETTVLDVVISESFGDDVCSKKFEVVVDVPPQIGLEAMQDTFTCGSPISLFAETINAATLQWYDEAGTLIGSGPSVEVDPDTASLYVVWATDGNDCQQSDSIWVDNYQLDLELTGNGIVDTCPMPFYNLCIENLDPTDILTFEWTASGSGTILSGATSPCPQVTTVPGIPAKFVATVSNQWGCESVEAYDVETYVFDPVIRDVLTICPGVPTALNPEAEGSTLYYEWSPQVGLDCYDCPNPVATLSEDQFYTVNIYGFNQEDTCSFTQLVTVLVNPPVGLMANPADTVICENVDLTLTAGTSSDIITDISWYNEGVQIGSGDEISVIPVGTESITVVATDTLGCTDTTSVLINAYPVDIELPDEMVFCEEAGEIDLTVVNNDPFQELTYAWNPEDVIVGQNSDGSTVTIDLDGPTTMYVEATNQFGCQAIDSSQIIYFDLPAYIPDELFTDVDTIILNSGESAHLETIYDPLLQYEWLPHEGLDDPFVYNPVAMPTETTTYTLTVTNEEGCIAVRQITIYVVSPDCREPNIFVPNAFTPNGDGNNDVLYVRSNIIESMEFAIYNRWGQKVFETTEQSIGWDGTYKGQELPNDVFGYYLKAKCFNGEEFFKKGNISLMR